jgi:uncharacterized SAM-dependent methyltransferase
MSVEREMTLTEYVGRLPEIHAARKELATLQAKVTELEKACEAAAEWFGPSLQDARFETVAVIKALREAGYDITKEHIL